MPRSIEPALNLHCINRQSITGIHKGFLGTLRLILFTSAAKKERFRQSSGIYSSAFLFSALQLDPQRLWRHGGQTKQWLYGTASNRVSTFGVIFYWPSPSSKYRSPEEALDFCLMECLFLETPPIFPAGRFAKNFNVTS